MLKLVSVYDVFAAPRLLYELLAEREEDQCISHRRMPTIEEHIKFIGSKPYKEWYLIFTEEDCVGAAYITKHDEIGVFIFKQWQDRGYGKETVKLMIDKHPGRMLANINPRNEKSIKMFESLGFRHIQNTYEH